MMEKGLSCREAFCRELAELGRKNPEIVALTSDARGSSALGVFATALPDQFIEVGIAEQNEIGMAAGLAAVGKRPYVCAPASFLSARALEQIKVDVAYSRMNVKLLAVSGGISYGALGMSHHSVHDVAALRAMPGIRVILPCDEAQTVALLRGLEADDEPAYIRVGKAPMPIVYGPEAEFAVGKASRLRPGTDLTIIACGEMVYPAIEAFEQLAGEGISAQVLDMHTLSPLDGEAIFAAAGIGPIITIEEHSVNGGLGASAARLVVTNRPVPMRILALPETENAISGPSGEVFRHYGLDRDGLCRAARELMKAG
ncbi:MAG: transketolase family protein [Planctomycetota bacterium]|jgi:transketolase|nr:transketolase family protein [Planctomycetota bacterium]